ncbi:MAG TPA: AI-2E family transporter [Candidatus Thermoplasmatota archaeon]|nr:AI-2E family transporter [Candidatus Thermoplasmatota archaeon]
MVEPARRARVPMPRQSQVFFFLVLGVMFYLSWQVFRDFIIYIITGIFVAVLSMPIDRFWERLFPNRVAAVLTMVTLFIMTTVPLLLLGVMMYNDATRLADAVEGGELDQLVNNTLEKPWAQKLLSNFYEGTNATAQHAYVNAKVREAQALIESSLTAFGTSILEALPEFFIAITVILFVVYYMLTDGQTFAAYVRRAAPLPGRQVDFLLQEARSGLNAVFMGQILVSVLQGVLGAIGFWITGLPNAVLWGAVMAVLGLLPVVGTFLVWVPAAIYLIMKGAVWQGIFMLLWGALVVTVVTDTFIKPKLIGSRADIHPMFVLVGVLGGAAAFGFIGLFLGPLLVGVTIAVLKVYEADYLDPQVNLLDEHVSGTGQDALQEPADPDTAPPA